LIAEPEFKFPTDLAAEYYFREVQDVYDHSMSPQELSSMGTWVVPIMTQVFSNSLSD
jgi:hypothetical protein